MKCKLENIYYVYQTFSCIELPNGWEQMTTTTTKKKKKKKNDVLIPTCLRKKKFFSILRLSLAKCYLKKKRRSPPLTFRQNSDLTSLRLGKNQAPPLHHTNVELLLQVKMIPGYSREDFIFSNAFTSERFLVIALWTKDEIVKYYLNGDGTGVGGLGSKSPRSQIICSSNNAP